MKKIHTFLHREKTSLKLSYAYSLPELLIVISIVTMLFLAALPSLSHMQESNKANNTLDYIQQSLKFARTQALNHRKTITFCMSDNSNCTNTHSNELSIFIDSNQNKRLDSEESVLRQTHLASNKEIVLKAAFGRNFIRFKSNGSVMETASLSYCPENTLHYGRVLKVNSTGRIYELDNQKEIQKALKC